MISAIHISQYHIIYIHHSFDFFPFKFCLLEFPLLFELFKRCAAPANHVPNSQLSSIVTAVVTVMEVVITIVGAEGEDLVRVPAKHVP